MEPFALHCLLDQILFSSPLLVAMPCIHLPSARGIGSCRAEHAGIVAKEEGVRTLEVHNLVDVVESYRKLFETWEITILGEMKRYVHLNVSTHNPK